jgi:two-component system sensor histidine kinase ResE
MIKNKLAFKIVAGYISITFISLLILGLLFIFLFREHTLQNKRNSMLERARDIAVFAGQKILTSNDIAQYEAVMELLDSSINLRVWIVDNNARMVLMSSNDLCLGAAAERFCHNRQERLKLIFIPRLLNGEEIFYESENIYFSEPMLTIGVPVRNAEHAILGAVIVHTPFKAITHTIEQALLLLVLGAGLLLCLAVIMGIIYSNIITKPINLMTNFALAMSKGDYTLRTNIQQRDEIGLLSQSLDRLAAELNSMIDQLFQEKNKLNNTLESITEGILAFDTNWQLISYNPALVTLLEYHPATDIKTVIRNDLESRNLFKDFITVAEQGERKVFNYTWNQRILKFILSPMKNNKGGTCGVSALIQDISESERLEQMRKDFLANVTHEIRTPLTIIKGSVEAIMDGTVTENSKKKIYQTRILEEAVILERLVNDLLDLSQLQAGKMTMYFEDIELNQLLHDTVISLKGLAQAKNIDITIDIPETCPAVWGDYIRLRQLFTIFLDNALKYSPPQTQIQITVVVQEQIYIRIKDEGLGIAEEDLPFVWDRFYKGDKARSQTGSGAGLGLAIAKHIIEAHDGLAWFEGHRQKSESALPGRTIKGITAAIQLP